MLSTLGNFEGGVISFAKVPSAKDPSEVMFRYSVLIVANMAPSIHQKYEVVMTPQEYASLLGLNASWELENPTESSENFVREELGKLRGKKISPLRAEILSMAQTLSSEWLHEQNESKQSEENEIVAHALSSWRIQTMQMVHDAVLELEKVDDNYLPRARLSGGSSEEEKKQILLDVLISASIRFGFPNKAVGLLDIASENVGDTLQSYSGLLCIVKGQLNKLDTEATKRLHDAAIADALAGLCFEDSDLDDRFSSDANETVDECGDESLHAPNACGEDGKETDENEEQALKKTKKDGSSKIDEVGGAAFTVGPVALAFAPVVAADAPAVGAPFAAEPVAVAAFDAATIEVASNPVEDAAVATAHVVGAASASEPVDGEALAAAPGGTDSSIITRDDLNDEADAVPAAGTDEQEAPDGGGNPQKKPRIDEID